MSKDSILAKLKEQFDAPVQHSDAAAAERPAPKSWKKFESIVKLSDFIKANKLAGMSIGMVNGDPSLVFNPGLKASEKRRWELAYQAEDLLCAAADDIRYCVAHGLLELPAGPSWSLE